MTLLDDISEDLTNESASLANTLRKAKILASRIASPDLREWVDSELNGYSDHEKVPSYRRYKPTNFGTFSGPFQSQVRNMVLPTYNLPDVAKEFADNLLFFEGVAALEGMLAQGIEAHHRKWPQEIVILAREAIQLSGGMVLVDAHQPIPSHLVAGILDAVKSRLLDFILGLEEHNVLSDGHSRGAEEREVVRDLLAVHIYGDHNVVASGSDVHQVTNRVQKGDIGSLLDHLRDLSVDTADLVELKKAVAAEAAVSDGEFGPQVSEWVGRMISKSVAGTWKIGVEAAPKILVNALNGFYGC